MLTEWRYPTFQAGKIYTDLKTFVEELHTEKLLTLPPPADLKVPRHSAYQTCP